MNVQEPNGERKRTIKIMLAVLLLAIIVGMVYTYGTFPYKKTDVMPNENSIPPAKDQHEDNDTSASDF
ncbi:MAG: hypothetical protein SFW35_06475 [Chitinophagales bacterium]|nr:hypothetical protein [Chitinophagales bacterium]